MKIVTRIRAAIEKKTVQIKKQILVIYFAARDPRVGIFPRLLIFVALGYALSPIDLIPDFIPILGLLDDVVILPVLITLAIKLIPHEVIDSAGRKAEEENPGLKRTWVFVPVIVAIWIISGLLIARWILNFPGL